MPTKHIPRKRFGQHFLRDAHVLLQMLHTIAPQPDDLMLEIGPGEGALTEFLQPVSSKLHLVEIDRDLVKYLGHLFATQGNVVIHQADALAFELVSITDKPVRIVGNLPYNISTPLLFHLFEQLEYVHDMHFLLQKEVVLRLCAPVGDSHYGRLSVMAQYFCENEALFDVGPDCFDPPPKVDSAFLRMRPRRQRSLDANDLPALSQVVQQAFNYRRKTIANAFKGFVSLDTLIALGINPKARPQQLTVDDYVRISNASVAGE